MSRSRFFTWVEDNWTAPDDVPERVRAHMRVLWSDGVTVGQIAETFMVPVAWVEIFVGGDTGVTKLH